MEDINIEMRRWFIKELQELTHKIMKEEEKRQERERKQAEKRLGEYRTYNDLQDAYGCGVITEKQFDRLATLLERSRPVESRLYKAKRELLEELYTEQKEILAKAEQFQKLQEKYGG